MLYLDKILVVILFLLISSCKKEKEHNKKHLDINREEAIEFSKRHFGESNYADFYKTANDTLLSWIENKLIASKMQRYSNWQLDSLLCFNVTKNKCIMVIGNQESETVNNSVNYLFGIKIRKEWYFFYGPTLYPDPSNHTPLSFTKLHEIAMDTIFKGYLKKNKKGEWEINDDFFGDFTSGAYGGNGPKTQAQWDSVYLQVVKNNCKNRDTTEYSPAQ